MTAHEHEIAAQTAVDVVGDFTFTHHGYGFKLKPETLDDMKRLILGRLRGRFELNDESDWGDVEE